MITPFKNVDFFLNRKNKTLTEIDKIQCEGLITKPELLKALKAVKNGKSPGTDGYTVEFYKFFLI